MNQKFFLSCHRIIDLHLWNITKIYLLNLANVTNFMHVLFTDRGVYFLENMFLPNHLEMRTKCLIQGEISEF